MTEKEMRKELTQKMLKNKSGDKPNTNGWQPDRLKWLLKESETKTKRLMTPI